MPKGYVISRVDITNPDAYARYAAAAAKAIAEHSGKPLARGGRSEALKGNVRARNAGVARRRCGNRNGASRGSVTHA
jgi:uncharacterized protein (DUF1330 family)